MNRLQQYAAVLAVGLAIAIGVSLLSPWASASPDGLEKVAEEQGFLERAEEPRVNLLRDYRFPGVSNERVSTILAGVLGVVAVLAITTGAGLLLARRRPDDAPTGPDARR